MSNIMTVAAPTNASPTPRQGEEFDVHFEQAGDPELEISADDPLELLPADGDPADKSQPEVAGSSEDKTVASSENKSVGLSENSENPVENPKQIVAETPNKSTLPDTPAMLSPLAKGGGVDRVDLPRTTTGIVLPAGQAGVTALNGQPTQGDGPGNPAINVGSDPGNLAAKGLQPVRLQGSTTQLVQNSGSANSVQGMAVPQSDGKENKPTITNPDALAISTNQPPATSRPTETSDLPGRAPALPNQSSGQAAPALTAVPLRGQAPELLTDGSKNGSETQVTQRPLNPANPLIAGSQDIPRLRELTVNPDFNGRVPGIPKRQDPVPVNLPQQSPQAAVSAETAPIERTKDAITRPVSGATTLNPGLVANEIPGLGSSFGIREANTRTDNFVPPRSRQSIRGDNARTIETATVASPKVALQTSDVLKVVQNQTLAVANIQPIAEQRILAADFTPSEHFVTPLSEPGLQTGNLRTADSMLMRPEAARMVASQMAQAVMHAQNNKVEIALHPEELGRVRMVLSTTELGVTVSIAAERPETLDLMRRHIDQLAQEFRALGYQNIGFEFSGGKSSAGSDGRPSDPQSQLVSSPDDQHDDVGSVAIQTARMLQSSGLDLRL